MLASEYFRTEDIKGITNKIKIVKIAIICTFVLDLVFLVFFSYLPDEWTANGLTVPDSALYLYVSRQV